MKHQTKRVLSVLLCLCMLLSHVPSMALGAAAASTRTIYFDNSGKNWGTVYVYAWNDSGSVTGQWPGTAMSYLEGSLYALDVSTDAVNIIFNNGSGSQTGDLTIPTDGKNLFGADENWYTYTVPETTYYLVGFINGANVGCEEDYQNMGDYQFVDGKLTLSTTADSYVFLKTEGNGKWYMTESYCTDTTATFIEGGTEKMLVPGNATVTFTLTENSSGSLTLSYVAVSNTCDHSYTSKVTTAATCTEAGVKTYTCSKCDESYTESIAATGHKFSAGSCTTCGALDPNYTVTDTGYVLVTDVSKVTAGKYVIVAGGKSIAMGTSLSSGKLAGTAVTVSGRIVTGDDLPVWTLEVVDGGIALSVDGKYLAYNSSTNFKMADSAYAWTVGEGMTLTSGTRGIYMQLSSSKFGAYASSGSTSTYAMTLELYKYQVGTQGCSHVYKETASTAATCTKAGSKTYTCDLCGDSYKETVAATGHSYEYGTCTVCGATDPSFQQTYYLVGYINGANYGCEGDYENMGSYKFVSGKLVTSFEIDSYVFLKTEGNAKWYMAESYCEDTTCTFIEGGTEKMLVPGNAEITFTLTENSDGSLTLSYTAVPYACEHSYTSKVTTAATCTEAGVKTYTCSKCGDTYTEAIAATGHSYANGSCTVCGALDPNYTVTDTGFVLVTDLSGITDGKYVIVAKDSGLAMGTSLSSGKLAGVSVTVDGRIVTGDDLPIWTVEVVDGGIALSVDGSYLAYNSSTNFKLADSAFTWSVSDGFVITDASSGRGIYMQISSSKFGAYSSATSSYVSELQLYKYQIGSQGCSHIYQNGSCTLCGEADPNYDWGYYLFGYINGADYGIGDDQSNLGTYKFEDGKLTAKFTEDSYVAVKSGNNTDFYMTNGYVGEATSATLYKFTDPYSASANKLLVPGGQTLHFTLTENWDGNLTISYTVDAADCQHTSHNTEGTCTTCGSTVEHTYSLGVCTVCGAQDPYYAPYEYYLFGYINGANYGCEEDASNLGTYLFVDGKLTTYFESDSYIGIKEVNPGAKFGPEVLAWYMTEGWQGEVTSATLYDSTTLSAADKLFVPGNADITFTMVKNEDGTVTVSYVAVSRECQHSYTSEVTTAATCTEAGVKTYTCSKCGDTYTEAIAATGHSYSSGSCTVCGALDPNYTVTDTGFVLVTDLSGITDGKYVIVAKDSGLAMGTSLSSGKLAGVSVTVDGRIVTGDDLPIWTVEVVDGGIALSVDGSYLAYNSSTNFKLADSAFTWSVSDGFVITDASSGRGIYMQISSSKFGAYSSATSSYVSNLQLYKYQVGTQGCNHVYEEAITAQPTCTAAGVKTFTCNLCGNSYTESIAATGHSYTSKVTTAATCTTAGVKTYTCDLCGSSYTEGIPATGHSFSNGKCTVCGVADPNCSHSYTSKVTTAATCTTAGVKTYTCSKCGSSYTEAIAATGHSYTSMVTTAATCTTAGVRTYTCSKCSDSYTETIASTGHSYKSVVTAPTCTAQGYTTYTCSACGNSYKGTYTEATGHSYTSKVTTAATCTTAGVRTYTCSKCSNSYTESIAATGHSFSNGKCIVCGTVDPNCSHSYTSMVTTAATCTTAGVRTYTCSKCGSSYTEAISATGHSYKSVVTAPTCTAQGYTTYTCSACGNSYQGTYTAATGHNYVNGSCTSCGATDPNASTGTTYYLFGYINGANYACEEDWENMGQYKFVNGKLTTTFASDSYVGVKTEGNGTWYMTEGWQGNAVTSVQLYDTNTLFAADKFFVPGGVQVTFTLTENSDGSLTLSYIKASSGPSTAPTVGLKYPSVSFEDMIVMNVYYTAENLQDVVEMGLITYSYKASPYGVDTAEHVVPGYTWSDADSLYYSSTAGIAPKDIGDTIYFAVYAKLADGTYTYTSLIGYSPKTYALNQLTSGTAEMKPLVVAMLNYGAAAQTYFGYKTDSLMNASLTSAQKALVSAYSSSMVSTVTQASGTKLGSFVNDSTYTKRYPTISFEGAFCINYYFQPSLAVSGNVIMYVWTLEDFNKVSVLTKSNATRAMQMTLTESGEYMAVIDGIAAKDLDKAIYVSFVYSDGTTEHCGGVIGYTIGMYCKSQASGTGNLAELAKACAVYGYYAKQLFNK